MKTLVIVLALAGVSPAFAKNDINPDTLELMNVLDMQHNQDAAINRMVESQATNNAAIGRHKATYLKFMQDTVGWGAIKNKVALAWQETFTKEEIKDLMTFYKSSTGKKIVRSMPSLMMKADQIASEAMKEHLPELQKKIEAEDKKTEGKKK